MKNVVNGIVEDTSIDDSHETHTMHFTTLHATLQSYEGDVLYHCGISAEYYEAAAVTKRASRMVLCLDDFAIGVMEGNLIERYESKRLMYQSAFV